MTERSQLLIANFSYVAPRQTLWARHPHPIGIWIGAFEVTGTFRPQGTGTFCVL